jgi:pilus assembly protein CpaE
MSVSFDRRLSFDAGTSSQTGRERLLAFVADEASEKLIRQTISDLSLPFSTVYRGGIEKAISHLETSRSPFALIVDISGTEMAVGAVNRLAEVCEPGVAVAVVGDRNDVGLYRDLMHAGVADYVVKPLTRALVQTTLDQILGQQTTTPVPMSQKLGRVVSVVGARGGVGSTTVAANLAWLLANKDKRRIALVDLDISFGDCALMLDIKQGGGLREVLEHPQRIDDLFLDRAMVRSGERLSVLVSEEKLDMPARIDPGALNPLFELLRKQFHYVIVDLPRSNTQFLSHMMEMSNTRIIVTDQTAHAIRDTLRMRPFYDPPQQGQRNLVVLNRLGEQGKSHIDVKALADTIGLPIDLTIPYDPKSVVSAANAGTPVVQSNNRVTTALEALANELSGRKGALKEGRRWPWQKE